jgi:alkanesulfonate monooxygenase SsuD/methylene tetrahydromethanopterin reductase-like flavin-dependent oxidoreductase (luciferase family)
MTLATTISLAALRGPVRLAKALGALDIVSGGRLVAGVGPGSSSRLRRRRDPFDDRWKRFDGALRILRALLRQERAPQETRCFTAPDLPLTPAPRQSGGVRCGSQPGGPAAGLRRVARLGDGWLASAYNITPDQFVSASALEGGELRRQRRRAEQFPNALVTMWTWITESRVERERVLADVLAPLLKRDVDELRDRVAWAPLDSVPSCCRARQAPDVSACTSGRWETSHDR